MKLEAMTGQILKLQSPIVQLPLNERWKRLFKVSGLFFSLAMVSVLIPGLHFILVPLFLFLTFWNGYKNYQQMYFQDMKQEVCPHCSTNLNIKSYFFSKNELIRGGYQLLSCHKCSTQIKLHKELHLI